LQLRYCSSLPPIQVNPMPNDTPDTSPLNDPTRWQETTLQGPTGPAAPPRVVTVNRGDLDAAVHGGVITQAQAKALWLRWTDPALAASLAAAPGGRAAAGAAPLPAAPAGPRFGGLNVLYYFGGMLAISAMTTFMTVSWGAFGAWGLLVLSVLYLLVALKVSDKLKARELFTPAGIMATLAVSLVPLIVWCVQSAMGLWPPGGPVRYSSYHQLIDWRWLTLEFATLAASVVMLWRYRLPFMVMPIAVTLWYMSMDMASMLTGHDALDWALLRQASMVFGIATCAIAMWVDIRTRNAREAVWQQDFAFWLYIFGALMFWGGLSLSDSNSELGRAGYALLNVVLVFLGAAIGRRVFTVLGALGVAGYLGYLSHRVFQDSLLFPLALTVLGLGMVALGIWWQRHEAAVNQRLRAWVPLALQPRDGVIAKNHPAAPVGG